MSKTIKLNGLRLLICIFSFIAVNAFSQESAYTVKDYPNATRIGYYHLIGDYSQDELIYLEIQFNKQQLVLDCRVLDKYKKNPLHIIYIKASNNSVTKKWLTTKIDQYIQQHRKRRAFKASSKKQ